MNQGIPLLKSPEELKPADILQKTPNTHPESSLEDDLWVIFRTDSGGGSATHLSYKILWLSRLLRKLGSNSTLWSDWRGWNQHFSKENALFSGITLFRKEEMGFHSQPTFSLQVILMCSKNLQKSIDRHLHRGTSFCRLHRVVLGRKSIIHFMVNTLSIQLRQVGLLILERLEEIKFWSPTLSSAILLLLNRLNRLNRLNKLNRLNRHKHFHH